ncbi:MAG TPA: hypothetical protein PLZ51_21375, partial [Aggregatilineales bacterium]|nr:hypothetical protein [Aggregatilineales bacterium]
CWLISEVDTKWVTRVEAGESLGDILFTLSHVAPDLSELDYAQVEKAQIELCAMAKLEVESRLEVLNAKGTLIIKYQGVKPLYRAFNPSTLTSMGDGRVVHKSMFQLIMPKYGKLASDETAVVDVMDAGELVIEAVPYTYTDGVLQIDTPHIQARLSHIEKRGDGFFSMIEDA